MMMFWRVTACLVFMLVSSCGLLEKPAADLQTPPPALTVSNTAGSSPEPSPQQVTSTARPPLNPQLQTGLPPTLSKVCSPLHGFQLVQLQDIISTPFDPPPPGSDGGHHGVDFGFYTYGPFSSMEGLPVQAILSGKVAAVIDDRPPYGNMVIIETAYSSLPVSWQTYLDALSEETAHTPDGRLACPTPGVALPQSSEKSLYLLYAHLADNTILNAGDEIGCGQQFNAVGNSGFSGNTHLHLEMRLGPAGVQFLHLAHYINDASAEEMSNYCTWRISPQFRLIDPIELLMVDK